MVSPHWIYNEYYFKWSNIEEILKRPFQRYFIDIKAWRLHLLVHVSFYRVYIKSLTKNKDLLNWWTSHEVKSESCSKINP